MSFEAETRMAGGVAIVKIAGRLVVGTDSDSLRTLLGRTFDESSHCILLDCEGILGVDSGSLGEIVSAYTTIVRRGGAMKLLRPQVRLREMLRVTRIDTLIQTCDRESQAVASFDVANVSKMSTT